MAPRWHGSSALADNPIAMNVITSTGMLRLLAVAAVLAIWWPTASRPRFALLPAILASLVLVGLLVLYSRWRKAHALRVIREHAFPAFLRQKLLQAHPHLDAAAAQRVERGLRQFFGANAEAKGRFVSMPSKVVDTLWHEFILHTRGYERFCRQAFGRMLHHTPAEALAPAGTGEPLHRAGLRRAWYWACRDESIDPRNPSRLPLLFALDASLGIAGGHVYALDCNLLGDERGGTHCASDLSSGCGSGCGGDGSSSGSDGGGADGGGDGGGGGCGGGGGD